MGTGLEQRAAGIAVMPEDPFMNVTLLGLTFSFVMGVVLLAAPDRVWAQGSGVKSYREWKTSRIQEAEGRLQSAKVRLGDARKADPNLAKASGTEGRDSEARRVEGQVRNEQLALEMARELTVSDYFAGYLTKLSDKNTAFKEVAGKLSPEEVAELMSAYANSVFGTQTGGIPSSSSAQNLGPDSLK